MLISGIYIIGTDESPNTDVQIIAVGNDENGSIIEGETIELVIP